MHAAKSRTSGRRRTKPKTNGSKRNAHNKRRASRSGLHGSGRGLYELLDGVLTQPTAPFRESWVKRAILSFCKERGLPVYEDEIGNLWAGARSFAEARRASLVFVAHLDHPGMVVTGFRQRAGRILARAIWLGGGPMDIRNHEVKIFSDVNALTVLDGVVLSHNCGPRGPKDVELEIKPSGLGRAACTPQGLKALGPWGACLWYRKQGVPAGVAQRHGLCISKAADDLVGACALLEALTRSDAPRGVVALLTRAEESGFHGTIAVLKKGWLDPARTLMVSVETSAQLPSAAAGRGPVVRLGDRATVFSSAFVYWVQEQAALLAARGEGFQYQRQVMDGGTCEATPFNCHGFQVAGISTPLLNYHNIAPNGRAEPEAVALSDVEGVVSLAAALMKNHRAAHAQSIQKSAYSSFMKKLDRNQREHERYFKGI